MLPVLRPLAHRSIALLWGGIALSAMGDQLFNVVLGWIAAATFGTNAGLLPAGQSAVLIATSLLSGRVADRLAVRFTLITADLARAAALGVMILLWLVLGAPPAWNLVATVAVLAVGMSFFRPAMQTMLPMISDRDMLPATNALMDMTERLARLIGPGLVSVAAASLALSGFVAIDLVSFLISALAVTLIRVKEPPRPAALPGTIWTSLLHGFRVVRGHRLLWFVMGITGIINGGWYTAYFIGLPLMLVQGGVTNGVAAFGLVISSYGVTNLIANLIVGNRGVSRRPHLMIFGGNVFLSSGIILLGLSGLVLPAPLLVAGFVGSSLLSAIGGPMQDITVATLRQTELPRGEIGAAVRAFVVVNQVGSLVALLASPLVFAAIGVPATVMLCGAAILVACATGLVRFRFYSSGSVVNVSG